MHPTPNGNSNPVGYSYNDTFTYEVCKKTNVRCGIVYMCGETQFYEMWYVCSDDAVYNAGVAPLIDQPNCEPCPGKL